ncbi:hypothetical protein [Flavobacterium sp. 25HG05S-40]|uniref:hypothetical protein n=1 Tax=Flavobacterium sp. 25HG05S-40 TaxID=3458682 RepID=UPI0040447C85
MRYNQYVKLIVSLYPAIAAIWIAFNKDSIINHTQTFYQHKRAVLIADYCIHYPTLIYWSLLICWVILYFTFVTNESAVSKKNTSSLESAIFKSPNPNIFSLYYVYYKNIMTQISEIDTANNPLACTKKFNTILKIIAQLTKDYINGKEPEGSINSDYSASIMIYIPYTGNEYLIKKMREQDEEWIHFKDTDLNSISGVLHLITEFGDSAEGVISISLPVMTGKNRNDIENKNLPGAPAVAALESKGDIKYVMSNVNDPNSYRHLGQIEVNNANAYWKKLKPKVISFVSFPISYSCPENANDKIRIIGVLNINSAKGDVLGDDKYHSTFTALIYPFLCQIAPHLAKYQKKYIEKLVEKYQ